MVAAGAGQTGLNALQVWPQVQRWADELGFSQIGVADIDLSTAEAPLQAWLAAGFHGSMHYMERHGMTRARPAELVPGTLRVLTARMDYLPRLDATGGAQPATTAAQDWQAIEWQRLHTPDQATVSIYARGRDYHKVLRSRLQTLADRIAQAIGPFGHRVFTDSAPVLEVELATRIDVCPTQAIVAPYQLDARRCISYLTIEHDGVIPVEFRAAMGNRIYGCDDCQLVCPWNKYAQRSALSDFDVRAPLGDATLLELWRWSEADFLHHTEGSAIRRIGHARWQRNLAVAMGNALRSDLAIELAALIRQALASARDGAGDVLREHIDWALAQ